MKFHGCKIFGSVPCQNTATEGEIVINPLKGSLGYINKAAKEVGIDLPPSRRRASSPSSTASILDTVVGVGTSEKGFAYLYPGGGGDGIVSPITPVNTMTDT